MQLTRILLVLLIFVSGHVGAREFTGKNGKKIEAEILSKADTTVELKLDTGKTVTIPLTSLSETDQLFVAVWESPEVKTNRLKAVDLAEVLVAKGFIPFKIENREQGTVVKIEAEGKEMALLVDHRNERPLIKKTAMEQLDLKIKSIENGGGNVLGTFTPDTLGNGSASRKGMEFYVVNLDGLPDDIDGMIGGQVFVDLEARIDFATKQLWLKGE